MAIRIVEGVIGSGKTYYAVNHLIENYFSWDKVYEGWRSKQGVDVYTNIDGFKLGNSLSVEFEKAGGFENFFTIEYQKNFVPDDKQVVYIIDEAQMLFDRKFYNKPVVAFFQWSRHLGVDIYLLTQDVSTLSKELQGQAEYHIEVKRRSLSLSGEFSYRFVSGGESFKTRSLRPNPRIFSLYRSMTKKEVEKIPSATRRYAFVFGGLIVFAVVFFYFFINIFFRPSVSRAEKPSLKPSVKAPVASLVAPESVKPVSGAIPSSSSGSVLPDVTFVKDTGLKSRSLLIVGLASVLDGGEGFILYRSVENADGGLYRASGHEFDRLCRCHSLATLKAGDVVQAL